MERWQLRLWGVRGSIPSPGPGTVRYGGNTSCLALERVGGGGVALILDAGTGIRPCGESLSLGDNGPPVELLLSHVHWDHIQGLPFFAPLLHPGAALRVRGPAPAGTRLADVLDRLLAPEVFPVSPAAAVEVEELDGAPFEVAGWTVRPVRLCHPGVTYGYRLRGPGGEGLAYVTDNELEGGRHGVPSDWRRTLVDFLAGAGTLVHDATNAGEEVEARRGWGHSSAPEAVALAAEAGCRRLVLFHHDPRRDDAAVDALLDAARAQAARLAPGLAVEAAREGAVVTVEPEG